VTIPSVVKILSKRWWIPIGARLVGPKLEPEGLKLEPEGSRAEMGFPTTDQGFSRIQRTLFGFMVFKYCSMPAFYPAEWWIPTKMCRISIMRYRICY